MIKQIIRFTFLSCAMLFAGGSLVLAQDEGNLPIKEESEAVRPDSIPESDAEGDYRPLTVEQGEVNNTPNTSSKISNILIIPAKPVPNPTLSLQENKPKIKEPKREPSFNIFHYLIYKFRSKEGSGT